MAPRKSAFVTHPHISVKKMVPPDYYVKMGYQNVTLSLHKTKQRCKCATSPLNCVYYLTNKQNKNALDTAMAGVTDK